VYDNVKNRSYSIKGGVCMSSKNKFEVINDIVHINREGWDKLAFTTYRQDYYNELTSATWTEDKGYLKNGKLGLLHRYIMKKWYGEEIVKEMTARGLIVDHMNNDGFDNRICNLEFLATRHNVAKGHTLDVESKEMRDRIAVNIFKDFTTNYYQISIGFNEIVSMIDMITGESQEIDRLYLLYDCDYRLVINDAEQILLEYSLHRRFNIQQLKCIEYQVNYTKKVLLTEEEIKNLNNGGCAIVRDGVNYFIKGKGIKLISAHYKEGWKPEN